MYFCLQINNIKLHFLSVKKNEKKRNTTSLIINVFLFKTKINEPLLLIYTDSFLAHNVLLCLNYWCITFSKEQVTVTKYVSTDHVFMIQ